MFKAKNISKIFCQLIIIPIVLIGCGSPGGSGGGKASKNYEFTEHDLAVIEDANLARTNPKEYAKKRLTPGSEAYNAMMNHSPVAALKHSKELIIAATGYAKYSVTNKHFGHNDPNGRNFAARYREDYGYQWASGENLAIYFGGYAGNPEVPYPNAKVDYGRNVVKAWVESPGHRGNLMSDYHTEMGVGWWTNNDKPRNDGLDASSIEIEPKRDCVGYCKETKYWFIYVQIFGNKPD